MRHALATIIFLCGIAQAQTDPTAGSLGTASYYLAPVAASGISGNLQVTEQLEGGSSFTVTLQGIDQGQRYALALFEGDCGPDRSRVIELTPVGKLPNDPYVSLTDTGLSFSSLNNGDYFLYVYAGDTANAPVAACGEVGLGANAATRPVPTAAATPPTPVAASESSVGTQAPLSPDRSPRAVSYALSAVENSGVSGNLQVSEQLEGGTRLTVSLTGISAGGDYAIVLHEGNCGPDRPEVARLENVNAADGNPNSSVTESALSFDAITTGNHFLYVFSGEPGGEILACGEVGL